MRPRLASWDETKTAHAAKAWAVLEKTELIIRRYWPPAGGMNGAGNGIRTRDFNLGKVALYH